MHTNLMHVQVLANGSGRHNQSVLDIGEVPLPAEPVVGGAAVRRVVRGRCAPHVAAAAHARRGCAHRLRAGAAL